MEAALRDGFTHHQNPHASNREGCPRRHPLRDEFWNGGPALNVYVVADYEPVNIERETINDLLDYNESFWPQGFWRVSDDRPTERVVQELFN